MSDNKISDLESKEMLMKEVLNGGYNVHPVPPPNSEIKERITKKDKKDKQLRYTND